MAGKLPKKLSLAPMDNKLELAENDYYKVCCELSQADGGKWLVCVRVIRKDTNESVKGGFTVFKDDKIQAIEFAKNQVESNLLPMLEKTGHPSDWKSEVRKVLVICKELRSGILKKGDNFARIIAKRGNEDKFLEKYAPFWKSLVKDTIVLSNAIQKLKVEERIELLTSPDEMFDDPSDSRSLEDLDLRILIFDFFSEPTEREVEAHINQKEKLASRFKELGWE